MVSEAIEQAGFAAGHIKELEKQLNALRTHSDYQIELLQERNQSIGKRLKSQVKVRKTLEKRNMQLVERMEEVLAGGRDHNKREQIQSRLAPKVTPVDLRVLNTQLTSEYEVQLYSLFDKNFLYSAESGITRKPKITPIGDKKKEIDEVMEFTLKELNKDLTTGQHKQYTMNSLMFGYQRQDRTFGTQYELYFHAEKDGTYQHVSLFRPFAPTQLVLRRVFDKKSEWVNIVMPLQGRLDKLEIFLSMYLKLIKEDNKLFLTIVYFKDEEMSNAKRMLEEAATKANYTDFTFVERIGNFSRGAALLAGANAWRKGNSLMFFCDVDIHFDREFLQRCRLNSAPGAKAYYPIVFSMYNPTLVYMNEQEVPKLEERFVIGRDNGFWRTFGFGMVCIYRSDFIFNKGFDTTIEGWGWEDVQLYRKLISSNLEVMRSPDPGIFHIWHAKDCDNTLSPKQYNMCLGSKAMADGTVSQLGMIITYGKT